MWPASIPRCSKRVTSRHDGRATDAAGQPELLGTRDAASGRRSRPSRSPGAADRPAPGDSASSPITSARTIRRFMVASLGPRVGEEHPDLGEACGREPTRHTNASPSTSRTLVRPCRSMARNTTGDARVDGPRRPRCRAPGGPSASSTSDSPPPNPISSTAVRLPAELGGQIEERSSLGERPASQAPVVGGERFGPEAPAART